MVAPALAGAAPACRVLLVDDDALITASTAAILEDLGHQVIEASSGANALEALRSGAQIDLVITDHAMPSMTGTELARQIRQAWPNLPIILASGYADLPGGEEAWLPRLAKPYRLNDLAAHIAKLVWNKKRLRRLSRSGDSRCGFRRGYRAQARPEGRAGDRGRLQEKLLARRSLLHCRAALRSGSLLGACSITGCG